jgi:hypothetical protein
LELSAVLLLSAAVGHLDGAPIVGVNFGGTASAQTDFQLFLVDGDATGRPSVTYAGLPELASGQLTTAIASGSDFNDWTANVGPIIARERGGPVDVPPDFTYGALYRDLILASNGGTLNATTLQLQLTDLDPNTAYVVTFYTYDNNNPSGTETIVNRTGGAASAFGSISYASPTSSASFTNGLYSLSGTVTTDGTGMLWFSFTNTGDNHQAILNGFQIASVPEPGECLLLLAGGGFFAVARSFRGKGRASDLRFPVAMPDPPAGG